VGKHPNFRTLLVEKLSPHLSSPAFQHWLSNGERIFGKRGCGLYHTGGSRHAIKLIGRLFKLLNLDEEVQRMCDAPTLNEQREIWKRSLRRVILSRLLSWTVVSSEKWLWKALGVPKEQRDVIEADYSKQADAGLPVSKYSKEYGHAIWEYVVNTLDPVVNNTLLRDDNHYYLLCLKGEYSRRCHPDYLKPTSYARMNATGAFDGLRIHTDEINEVIDRMSPGTLTIAVVMDSMDWFDPESEEARKQIRALNRSLTPKGRVLLRSAGLKPWYMRLFEEEGFKLTCVGERVPGTCIDRSVSPTNIASLIRSLTCQLIGSTCMLLVGCAQRLARLTARNPRLHRWWISASVKVLFRKCDSKIYFFRQLRGLQCCIFLGLLSGHFPSSSHLRFDILDIPFRLLVHVKMRFLSFRLRAFRFR
jgi:betaine lipid synthase